MLTDEQIKKEQERKAIVAMQSYAKSLQEILHDVLDYAELPAEMKEKIAFRYDIATISLHRYWAVLHEHDWREEYSKEEVGYEFDEHGPFVVLHRHICDLLDLDERKMEFDYYDSIKENPAFDPRIVDEEQYRRDEEWRAENEELRKQLEEKYREYEEK